MAVSQARAAEGPWLTTLTLRNTHAHTCAHNCKHAQFPLSCLQWQMPTHTELRASECVLVNDKLQPKTTDPYAALLRDFLRSLTGWPSSIARTHPLAFSSTLTPSHLRLFHNLPRPTVLIFKLICNWEVLTWRSSSLNTNSPFKSAFSALQKVCSLNWVDYLLFCLLLHNLPPGPAHTLFSHYPLSNCLHHLPKWLEKNNQDLFLAS